MRGSVAGTSTVNKKDTVVSKLYRLQGGSHQYAGARAQGGEEAERAGEQERKEVRERLSRFDMLSRWL